MQCAMMAAPENLSVYADALVVLGTAGIIVPVMRRLGIRPVLAYLAAGALLGPLALGSLRDQLPALRWVTIGNSTGLGGLAELGVVFLLFLIGLELSLARLKTMRRLVFGLGSAQVIISTTLIALILMAFGQSTASAVIIAACLALSSTAIVIEILSEQGRMSSSVGRTSFSVLLAQDIAVAPLLLMITLLAVRSENAVWTSVALAFGQAMLALALIVLFARVALRPLFRLVAHADSTELFMAATLFVIVGTSVLAGVTGLSMALGAFVAGLMLAETEYRKTIQTLIEPFKGLLLGLFFFTVGMGIDGAAILRNPLLIIGAVLSLVLIKAVILYGLARLFKVGPQSALETALLLGPAGEFAFVGIGAAVLVGLVTRGEADLAFMVTSLSMVLVPVLAALMRRVDLWRRRGVPLDQELAERPEARSGHAIVVGHGRVGQVVTNMLRRHKIDYIATDSDPASVTRERRRGAMVYFGNATDPQYLRTLGIESARAVIITIHSASIIDTIVKEVRALRPDVPVVSRARDGQHAAHLYAIGVTDAVPETLEASLQLSEAALVGLGVPVGYVIASVHEMRDEFRADLQVAAQTAGREESRAIKPKVKQA